MATNAPPSRNPANSDGQMAGAFREILGKFLKSEVDDMLPARVIAYDRDTNRATVQPLIAMVTTAGDPIRRNQLASVPVLNIGGGGFILSFNMSEGDLGWIKANDRDIRGFLQTYKEDVPSTGRCHDFNNGVFIPDVMTGYTIDPEDDEACVLQSLDGTVRIALHDDRMKITTPDFEVDAPLNKITGALLVEGFSTLAGNAALGGAGGLGIARIGDSVSVTVVGGSSAGVHTGTITGGSALNTAT